MRLGRLVRTSGNWSHGRMYLRTLDVCLTLSLSKYRVFRPPPILRVPVDHTLRGYNEVRGETR